MLLTVDSSSLVAATLPAEPAHMASRRVFRSLVDGVHHGVLPVNVIVEVAAALRRRTGSELAARRIERDLRSLTTVQFVPVDDRRTAAAVRIASRLALRGMDAIVVQVAQELGATLVTLDAEMAQRAASIVGVRDVTTF